MKMKIRIKVSKKKKLNCKNTKQGGNVFENRM